MVTIAPKMIFVIKTLLIKNNIRYKENLKYPRAFGGLWPNPQAYLRTPRTTALGPACPAYGLPP